MSAITHNYLGTINGNTSIDTELKYDLNFKVTEEQRHLLETYMNKYSNLTIQNQDYLTNALDFITPRRKLRYETLSIE